MNPNAPHCTAAQTATVTVHTTWYVPGATPDAEPIAIDALTEERTITTDDPDTEPLAQVVAEWLHKQRATAFSEYPEWRNYGWWSAEPYVNLYTGVREERTFDVTGVNDAVHRGIWHRLNDR